MVEKKGRLMVIAEKKKKIIYPTTSVRIHIYFAKIRFRKTFVFKCQRLQQSEREERMIRVRVKSLMGITCVVISQMNEWTAEVCDVFGFKSLWYRWWKLVDQI
jgi:hypothetical protein